MGIPYDKRNQQALACAQKKYTYEIQGIENRKSKKDFWDIACLLDQYSIWDMFLIMQKKFPFVDAGHLVHSFTYFDEADLQQDPVALNDWT